MSTADSTQNTAAPGLSSRTSLILAVVLPIFLIAPLFYPGYFQTHSGFVPLWNVVDLRINLGNWSWLPHIATSFDPLRSDGLLPYYLAALLPLKPVAAVKVVLGGGWLLGSLGTFLWLRSWLGRQGALVAGLIYSYLPFQIATVYVRGAWGEALFWGLLPWAILSATFLVNLPRLWLFLVAALSWLALGLSQLGLSIWALIFVALLVSIFYFRQSLWPILAALLGTGVTLVLYLLLTSLSVPSAINLTDHFLYPFQLFSAFWGFGASRPDWKDGLSLQLGLAAVGLTIVTMAVWHGRRRSPLAPASHIDRRLLFFSGSAIALVFLQLGLAGFVWELPLGSGISLAYTLTYPWQLLGLSGLCLAILAGAVLWLDSRLSELPLFGAIVIFIILSSYSYLSPQFTQTLPLHDGPAAQLGKNQLVLLDHNFAVSTSANTAGHQRDDMALPLVLYGPPQANHTLVLNVVWQPLRPFSQNLKVFVHLVDVGGVVLAQYDGYPRDGTYPTTDWIPGEVIPDSYSLLIPADAPAGPYLVHLGLYDEDSLIRLSVPTDSEGRVILNVE